MVIKTGNVSVSVLDDADAGVQNAVITLTNKAHNTITFSTSASGTGSTGGATISNVSYGTYAVSLDLTSTTGYTAPTSINDLVVDSDTETLNIEVTKN